MGRVSFIDGDDEAVQQAFMDDVLARYRDLGDERAAARAAWSRGILALGAGRVDEALPLPVMVERFEDAAVLHGAWDGLCERYGVRPPMALSRFIQANDPFAAARAALPADVHARAYERGRHLALDAAVAMIVAMGADFEGMAGAAPGAPA